MRTPTPEPEKEKEEDENNSDEKNSGNRENGESGDQPDYSSSEPIAKRAKKADENVYKLPVFMPLEGQNANLRIPKVEDVPKVR